LPCLFLIIQGLLYRGFVTLDLCNMAATEQPPQCNESFADSFRALERELVSLVGNDVGFNVTKQRQMHVSLAYVCCVTADEWPRMFAALTDWTTNATQRRAFDFDVTFNRVEPWRESNVSISNIVVLDTPSQRQVSRLYDELVQHLHALGLPNPVGRQHQMPFHATLVGFKHANMSAHEAHVVRAVDALNNAAFTAPISTTLALAKMSINDAPRLLQKAR